MKMRVIIQFEMENIITDKVCFAFTLEFSMEKRKEQVFIPTFLSLRGVGLTKYGWNWVGKAKTIGGPVIILRMWMRNGDSDTKTKNCGHKTCNAHVGVSCYWKAYGFSSWLLATTFM